MKNKGLSMLEVLIAAVILALIIAAIGSTFVIGKKHVMHSIDRMTAAELARFYLDNLSMQSRQDQDGSNCLTGNTGCSRNSHITFDKVVFYDENITTSNSTITGLCKATVNITWDELTPQ